jgi:hypothetical protein
VTAHFLFLSSIFPQIHFEAHSLFLADILRQTGLRGFSDLNSLCGTVYAGRSIILIRLFIPLLYSSDWFFYFDDDIMGNRDFFPTIMKFTTNREKVMFGVVDSEWIQKPELKRYLVRVRKPNLRNQYFGSGVLLMRGGEVLRTQLRAVLQYLQNHPRLGFPDQDALNFAFDRSVVELLPAEYCIIGPQLFTNLTKTAYLKHFANTGVFPVDRRLRCFATPYRIAYQKWQKESNVSERFTFFNATTDCP